VTVEKDILYETSRLALRRLAVDDKHEFIQLVNASAEFLYPWVNLPSTPEQFDNLIHSLDNEHSMRLLICLRENDEIVGSFAISEVIRGPYQRATVGYNAFAATAGRGYMSEGFRLIFQFAFGDLGLHRLEADIQPTNEASSKLIRRVGFRREGYSPGFVNIRGSWKGHERWAITSDMAASC
jgi:ribosomal-protein-alanine N-acetyltransferase